MGKKSDVKVEVKKIYVVHGKEFTNREDADSYSEKRILADEFMEKLEERLCRLKLRWGADGLVAKKVILEVVRDLVIEEFLEDEE